MRYNWQPKGSINIRKDWITGKYRVVTSQVQIPDLTLKWRFFSSPTILIK
jgi:hypothetical protein